MPLMVTGGFRSTESVEAALAESSIDVIGLARPLIMQPEIARAFRNGAATEARVQRARSSPQAICHHWIEDGFNPL